MMESERDWAFWEMHPNGDEFVMALSGQFRMYCEDGSRAWSETLVPGQFIVVKRGIWHTADVLATGRMLFITQGEGTLHRGR
ncbi:MAG: cupin domain-containing protein [Parvularcula sp.]|jgi:quercetin dioxygenase-like cupin family protein|nr:cupin domain-containing protein [Parvularcula sp.]